MEKLAEDKFHESITAREHAIFELGIKLATLYHMMLGAPIKNEERTMKEVAEGLMASIRCQPFVEKVDVTFKVPKEGMSHTYTKLHQFDYTTISGKMLTAQIKVKYQNWAAVGRVEWDSDLYYPLMSIKEIYEE